MSSIDSKRPHQKIRLFQVQLKLACRGFTTNLAKSLELYIWIYDGSMSVGAVVLPIVTVQPDFGSVISDVRQALVSDEAFWLSCYKAGETSVHGKVLATLDDVDRDLVRLEGRDGVGMEHHNEVSFVYPPFLR